MCRARIVTEFTRTHSVPPAVSCIIFFDGGILLPETGVGGGKRGGGRSEFENYYNVLLL